MELEKLTAEIRPRTQWEAVDLGVSLTREHIGIILKTWLTCVIPLCLLILGLFWNHLFWGCFLIWWLKPIWERVTLYPLSRNLFGESPSLSQGVKVLPQELKRNWKLVLMGCVLTGVGLLAHREVEGSANPGLIGLYWLVVLGLLFYRSNLYRSLVLPIQYLEGLEKKQLRARSQVLSFRSSGTASALTALCLAIEVFVFYNLFLTLEFLIPEGTNWGYSQLVEDFIEGGPGLLPNWFLGLVSLGYLISMTLGTWFYVGGGFGLYINSRTWTEGWDIELTFKKLGQRFGLVLAFFCFFFVSQPMIGHAEEVTIESILESEDFEIQTREVRTWKEGEKKEKEKPEQEEEKEEEKEKEKDRSESPDRDS